MSERSEKPEVEEAIKKLALSVSDSQKATSNDPPPPITKPKPIARSPVVQLSTKSRPTTDPAWTSSQGKIPIFDPALASRRRAKRAETERIAKRSEPLSVNQGPVGEAIALAFNPSRDKIREVTIVDSIQARLLPLLDTTNHMFQYVLEVAQFRQDPNVYREIFADEGKDFPEQPDCIDQLLYRMAQWQKSRGGKNLERITDIALAEVETKAQDEGDRFGSGGSYSD